jgi:tetratricopeptide (TPR) repeat protein
MAVFTPPRLPHTSFNPTPLSMGVPAPMNTDFDELLGTILAKVKDLYISYPVQKKWKVEKQREVEEDIHDDLLVGVASSLRDHSSLSPAVGYIGFQKALQTLEKVVGVGEGADCGLFSLPAIWVSFLRMIRDQRSDWAREFLSLALKLAMHRFGREHQLVQVLLNLQGAWIKEPGQLEEVIFMAYRSCIAQVKEELGAFNLTYLSLWGDYVVYLDGKSTNETHAVVNDIRSVIKISEEEKGPDGGPDGDYTLELLGLTLYVLQSAPTMVEEAEKVAKELLVRVNQRRLKAGGQLEGNLFITWKDLRQTLGTFCHERKDYHQAIYYLEDFLNLEIVDGRDNLELQKLEGCYRSLGRHDDAEKVWQLRMDNSQRLLQKSNTVPVGGEKVVVNDHGERDDDDGEDVSEEEGSSEATIVDQGEESNEGNLEEDDTDEIRDCEVEIQLRQEQIAGLKQRLNVLKRARRKGKDCDLKNELGL